jgi:DNA helicase IV
LNYLEKSGVFGSTLKTVNGVSALFDPKKIFDTTINKLLKEKCDLFKVDFVGTSKSKDLQKYHLYLHLLFWNCFKGKLDNGDKYLHIDEGQDLSVVEYEILSKVNKDAVFNVYGDVNQLITLNRGVNDWNKLRSIVMDNDIFELNENYRNTVEVTEYCNNCFGFNMLAIGINGLNIRHISTKKFDDEIKELPDDSRRIAIIAKDDSVLVLLPQKKRKNLFYQTVKSAKGIEFDAVYVFDKGLTANEKYVAYTRSLNDWIIVED